MARERSSSDSPDGGVTTARHTTTCPSCTYSMSTIVSQRLAKANTCLHSKTTSATLQASLVRCSCQRRPFQPTHSLPRLLLLLLLVLAGCFVHQSQAAEADVCTLGRAQWNPDAVARFGLSISLRKVDNKKPGGCGVVSQEALQLYVAAQWVLERLNADHGNGSYVPGVQFGFDLLDDCRSPTRALQYALDFADLNSDCRSVNDTSTNLKLGVVGPTRSSTAEETADAMRSLPFPIISPAATLASLTEGTTDHSNFFRTVPSDNLQTEVMVSILKRLHWTFVAIVYTSDNYGTMGARTLEKHARANNVCVDVSVPLIKGNGGMETVVSKLIEMRDRAESKSVAVVFIGEKDTAEFFVYNLKLRALFGFHFIMSDSVSTNTEVFNSGSGESTDFKNIALGSLTLVPSSVHLQDFEDYLNKKYRDVQDGIVRDPQIESWLQSLSQPWDRQRIKQIPFVPLTVGAIFALAEATRLAHEEMCGGEHGACQRLLDATRDGIILKHVKNITVDFSNMSDRVAPAKLKSLGYVLEFDEKGDVRPNPGLPDYSVYAFDDNNQPPYLNVGNYSTGNLKLDISSVHMYTWDGQMTRQLQTSVCMGSCPLCADNGKVPLAHLPGSAYIVGVFSVHERNSNNPFTCGDYRNVSTDVVVLEAFLHVVKQLRASTGVNFGAVAFDDCYSPLHMTSVLSDFLSGLVPFDKGLFDVCVPREKVVGVVGCLSSDSTLATASFFTPLHTPVISYAASSPDLDDKTSYPYFLRTVPSDEEQAVAMAELILAMGWEYVGLLHVSNNYGTKGAMAFQRAARARRLCVADPVKISPEPEAYDETYLDDQFTKLRQTGAKVVVFFGIDTRIADMLRLIEARNHQGQIIFISSEEWANKRDVLDAGYKAARGSITFKVDNVQGNTTMQNSFNQYLVRKSPSETDVNPWFSEFWQHMFDCNLAGGFNNIFDEVCKDSYRLSSDQVTKMVSDQRVQHVMNAVQALGQGLAAVSHSNTDTVCESSFPCDNLHDEAFAPQVLKVIKSQTLPSVTARRNRIFDDNGNGKIGFTIYNVQRKTNDDYDYVYVGSYDSDRGLQLQKESIVFYSETGVPKKSIDASCTDERCSASQCVFPSDVLPSPAPQTQDEKFRVADLVILIVLLAACLLLVCGMILGFTYFRRKVKGLSKELQEHKVEPIYHEAQERRVYGNVDAERLMHAPTPCPGPAPTIRFVNSLDSRGTSPGDTLDGHTNPAFRSDSSGLQNAYSEQSLNHMGPSYPLAPPRPHRAPNPPLTQNGSALPHPDNFYTSDPVLSGESDTASSQHNYYMAHSLSSVRELPAIPGSAPVLSQSTGAMSPQSQQRHENIPLRSLSSGNNSQRMQQQQQQPHQHYLNHHKLEDPLQSGQVQYQQQGDMEQIQYFRMTPSGQLEEEDEEEEEEEGVDEEEETAVLNTYSLSPPSSRANGTQYDGHVGNQPQSFPQTHYSGNLPSIQMTPELREMLLQQLAEDLLKQQHQQQQQQQELKQSLQSPSSSSLGSSSQDSMSSQAGKRRQKADQAQYQQQLSQPTSLVYPSSSSMSDNQSRSDSAMGSSHSSQPMMGTQGRQVPQYQKQVSTPVGTGYLSPASDHQSPRMVRYPQTQQAGIPRSSPYAQLAQIQQQVPTDMSHTSSHQSTRIARDNQPQEAVIPHSSLYAQLAQIQQQVPGDMSPRSGNGDDQASIRGQGSNGSEQGDSASGLSQASPRVRWTLESLHSMDDQSRGESGSDGSQLEQVQQQHGQQQRQQQQPQQRQQQQPPQQQQPQQQPDQQMGQFGMPMHITRV